MGELRSAVDTLAAVDPDGLDDAALGSLLTEVTAAEQRLAGIRHRLVAAHDRRQAWRREGFASEAAWLRERCRWGAGRAAAQARLARGLRELPRTAQAVVDGEVDTAQAAVAVRALPDLPVDASEGLDRLVVEHVDLDSSRLRGAVDDYAHRVCAESLERREERAWRARRLSVRRTVDGAVVVDGRLDPVGGETLLTAVAALAAPRDAHDERTGEQRRADALVALAQRSLDDGDLPGVAGERPHVTVVVDLATMQGREEAPAASLDRLGRVCGESARRVACDANLTRVLTRGGSQPLDVGRRHRVVTPAQRKALAVRDRGCIGCGAPAGWCQAHHVTHWADGGATDLDNLVLVCHPCHRTIHHHRWRPTRQRNGRWALDPPVTRSSP
jgi:hypothetical protein